MLLICKYTPQPLSHSVSHPSEIIRMAEAAGLVVGAVSVAGLFTNCVDCFEYVQMGRNFGKNYQRSLLRVDVVKLRLSRWAEVVNNSSNCYGPSVDTTKKAQKVG